MALGGGRRTTPWRRLHPPATRPVAESLCLDVASKRHCEAGTVTTEFDQANAEFWNELCGSTFARAHGIVDHSLASLERFDEAYFAFYPYLLPRVGLEDLAGKTVLEMGLGYGSLSQKIASVAAGYTGLDIAAN